MEYHVAAGLFGIYAGILKNNGREWKEKTECTDETLRAVRDYLKGEADAQALTRHGYQWKLKKGGVVRLVIEIECEENNGHTP